MPTAGAQTGERTIGFFYGPVIVATAMALQAIGWGIHNGFGVFFNPILDEFGWSRAAVSGAASLSYWVYGLLSILMGNLSDRFGPRRVMRSCGLLLAGGLLLMSQVRAVWQMYVFYGLVIGTGISSVDVVLLSTAARWYVRKRGAVSGTIKAGTGIGMLFLPLLLSWLIAGRGWRFAFLILGIGVGTAFFFLARLLLRDPGEIGQYPDGLKRVSGTPTPGGETGLSLATAAATRTFWVMCTTNFLILLCTYTLLMHIVPHGIDLGLSGPQAAGVLSTLGGASIAGRLVLGTTADRIGYRNALVACFGLLFSGLCLLQWAVRLWQLHLFALVHGFAHGGFFALIPPTVAWLFGTRSHGSLFGAVIFSGAMAGALGPLAAGWVFDLTGSYRPVFLALIVFSLAGMAMARALEPERLP